MNIMKVETKLFDKVVTAAGKSPATCIGSAAQVLCFALVAASLVLPATVTAQAVLEEVVVTAQKRSETIQDVPISINVISGDQIVSSGITDLGDLGQYVPNFSYNQTGISSTLKMRGISSGINPGFEQSVGMYIDGIYYGRGQLSRVPYLDINRVEVLRGPQSVLFGKNTIAGALNIQTERPGDELDGHARFTYEHETGREEYSFAAGGKIANLFSARFSYLRREVSGYYDNIFLNRDESDDFEEVARLGLLFGTDENSLYIKLESTTYDSNGRFLEVVNPAVNPAPADGNPPTPFSAVLAALVGPDGESGTGYQLDTRQDYRRQSNGDTSFNDHGVLMFEFNKTFDDGGLLTIVGGRNQFDTTETCDCDFTSANIFSTLGKEDYSQDSIEVRYASPGNEVVDYVVGGYLQRYDQSYDDFIIMPATNGILPGAVLAGTAASLAGPLSALLTTDAARTNFRNGLVGLTPQLIGAQTGREFTQDSNVFSIFAQVTYNINENMRLVFGGRYTDESKTGTRRQFHIDGMGVDHGSSNALLNAFLGTLGVESYDRLRNSRDEDVFTPLVTWQWDFLPGHLWYVTYTQGYKAGGFDVRSNQHPGLDYQTNPGATTQPYNLIVPGRDFIPPGANTNVVSSPEAALALAAFTRLGALGPGSFEYEEERADTFEMGVKSTLADGAAEFNVSIFSTSYEDLQISQFDGVLRLRAHIMLAACFKQTNSLT
jgi:outer membrane receptor protein involved in Fe transport